MNLRESLIKGGGQQSTSHRTPPIALIGVLVLAVSLLLFDEKDFSGWVRVSVIWATAVAFCLLTVATVYWIMRRPRLQPGATVSRTAYAACFVFCGWLLVQGVRNTEHALDPNRWLEISMQYARLPVEIEPGETFYTLNLDPEATGGLIRLEASGDKGLSWPETSRPVEDALWWGWRCSLRNRGMRSLSDISFDALVDYSKAEGHPVLNKDHALRHIQIPNLAPNADIELLLASVRDDLYVEVHKPKVVLARIGNETQPRYLHTHWLPFDKFWDGFDYWFLNGPHWQHSHNPSGDTVVPKTGEKNN